MHSSVLDGIVTEPEMSCTFGRSHGTSRTYVPLLFLEIPTRQQQQHKQTRSSTLQRQGRTSLRSWFSYRSYFEQCGKLVSIRRNSPRREWGKLYWVRFLCQAKRRYFRSILALCGTRWFWCVLFGMWRWFAVLCNGTQGCTQSRRHGDESTSTCSFHFHVLDTREASASRHTKSNNYMINAIVALEAERLGGDFGLQIDAELDTILSCELCCDRESTRLFGDTHIRSRSAEYHTETFDWRVRTGSYRTWCAEGFCQRDVPVREVIESGDVRVWWWLGSSGGVIGRTADWGRAAGVWRVCNLMVSELSNEQYLDSIPLDS